MRRMLRRRRSGSLCAAAVLAVASSMGPGPASAAPAADPAAALADPDALATVEALEARVKEAARTDAVDGSELREIEAGFINLLDSQPQEPRLRADLADFYLRWGTVMEGASPAALRLVSGAPDPVGLAYLLHRGAGDLGADLLFAALAQESGTPDVWLEAARNARNPAWSIVAFEEAVRRLLARQAGPDTQPDAQPGLQPDMPRLAAAAAESALELDVEVGQFDRASAMLAALPAAVRAVVESGATEKVQVQLDGVEIEADLQDVRQDLALLSLARGDVTSADRWLASQPITHRGSWYNVLAAWRQAPDDSFEVLTSHLESNDEDSIRGGRSLALAAVARRDGYPALEARYLRSALSRIGNQAPPAGRRELAPPGIAAAAMALEAEIGASRSRLEERLERCVEEAHAALGPDPMASVVDRLLRAPLLVKFPEHPLPAGLAPLTEEERHRDSAAQALVRLPPELDAHFVTVRAERRDRRAAVIGLPTQDDNSRYQVFLSADGGTTWSRPLSAGLELSHDYDVLAGSSLPLLAGDHLHVEVVRREADPDAESETATERAAAGTASAAEQAGRGRAAPGIYLDIPLAALARDSDGDGLTDLAEEELVTDPRDPDTDRDGVMDGADRMPQVAPQRRPGPESLALAAMFAAMEARDRSGASPDSLHPPTEFWIADRQLFTAVHPRHRLVVLTPAELGLAEKKLGPLLARTITLFVLDHAGTEGFVIWTTGNWGESFYLTLESGGWRAYPIQIGGV